jgi:hypothetical protein
MSVKEWVSSLSIYVFYISTSVAREHCLLFRGFSPKLGFFTEFLYIISLRSRGGGGGGQRPVLPINESKWTGARSAGKTPLFININRRTFEKNLLTICDH